MNAALAWIVAVALIGYAALLLTALVSVIQSNRLGHAGRMAWLAVVAFLPVAGPAAWAVMKPHAHR